jgi:purine-binding chemotaxis protein CheW
MNTQAQLVVFRVDHQRYGLPLNSVERLVRAAHVTRLPNAPANVMGVIDVAGRVIPVLDIRKRFQHERLAVTPNHQFLIAKTSRRSVILVIDEALGVIDSPDLNVSEFRQTVEGLDQLKGAFTVGDDLLLIQDLEKFLSVDEELSLDQAIKEGALDAS